MNLLQYRIKYGECFVSVFEDLIIPWRKLTLQEWLNFNRSPSLAFIVAEVEDLIFSLCVLDATIKENIDLFPAGIVSSVANQILIASGPETEDQINISLEEARARINSVFYSFIPFVCSVFPAYKPEDLLVMNYETFMERVALAEKRLIELNVLGESGFQINSTTPPPVQQQRPTQPKKDIVNNKLGDLSKPSGVVISKQQMASTFVQDGVTGHELSDKTLWQADVVAGLEHVYPEYFKMMAEGKKITSDTIHQVKGTTPEQVKKKHEVYSENFKAGKIRPPASNYLIADKMEGQSNSKPTKKKRAVITRVKK